MPILQIFSVSQRTDQVATVVVESEMTLDTLAGTTIEWSAFGMAFGVPLPSPRLIEKSSASGGVTILESPPMTFVINLTHADTNLEPGAYYHEAVITDAANNRSVVMYGPMAVTLAVAE